MSQHVYKHKCELPHRREAQILGSASSRSQLQNLMIKAVESGWRNNYNATPCRGINETAESGIEGKISLLEVHVGWIVLTYFYLT
jgi:hypothetical protein